MIVDPTAAASVYSSLFTGVHGNYVRGGARTLANL